LHSSLGNRGDYGEPVDAVEACKRTRASTDCAPLDLGRHGIVRLMMRLAELIRLMSAKSGAAKPAWALAIGLAAGLLASAGAGADTLKPQDTEFKSWTLTCIAAQASTTATEQPKKVCWIYHRIYSVSDTKQILFIVQSRFLGPERTPMMILKLPPGANLQRGVDFQIDNGQVYKVTIQLCTPEVCNAQFKLTDELLKAFRGATQASFAFAMNPKAERVQYAVPMAGFAEALDALKKTGS